MHESRKFVLSWNRMFSYFLDIKQFSKSPHFGSKHCLGQNSVRYFLLTSTFVLTSFVILGCNPFTTLLVSEATPVSWETFTDTVNGFSINYPSNWSSNYFSAGYHNDQEALVLFNSHLAFPTVLIAHKEMQSPTLEDVALWGETRILGLNDDYKDEYEIFNLQYTEINGQQIITREYTMDTETSLPLKKKDVYIARNNDGIIITFTTAVDNFDSFLPFFDQMVSSFKSTQ